MIVPNTNYYLFIQNRLSFNPILTDIQSNKGSCSEDKPGSLILSLAQETTSNAFVP
jgi:hypothetical protein